MDDSIIIRHINIDELGQLAQLYKQLRPKDIFDIKKMEQIFREDIENNNNNNIFVAIKDNKIIASCTLIIIHNLTHNCRPYGIIENVVTCEKYRRCGYGKVVIDFCVKYAQDNMCHKIMLQTRQKKEFVLEFYRKCGFSTSLSIGFMLDLENGV